MPNMPLAPPLRWRGAEATIVLLFGVWNRPKPHPAQGHAPNNVAVARVRGKYAEQEQSAGENRQADTTQYAGVDPFGEYARQWGEDHRGQRPRVSNSPQVTASLPNSPCRKKGNETIASIWAVNDSIDVEIDIEKTGMRSRSTG